MKKIFIMEIHSSVGAAMSSLSYETDGKAKAAATTLLDEQQQHQAIVLTDDFGHSWFGRPRNVSHCIMVDIDKNIDYQIEIQLAQQRGQQRLEQRVNKGLLVPGLSAPNGLPPQFRQ